MKKIIGLTCLLSAFVLNANAEIKTGFLSPEKTQVEFNIEEGQVGQIIYLKRKQGSTRLVHEHLILNGKSINIEGYSSFPIAGPAKLKLSFRAGGNSNSQYYWPIYSFETKPNSYGAGDGSGNNVTV